MKRSQIILLAAFIFLKFILISSVNAQVDRHDSLSLRISFAVTNVSFPEDLKVKIEIRNTAKTSIDVYQYLAEGYMGDNEKNLYFQVEKQEDGKFKLYEVRSHYQRAPGEDSDYIPRLRLAPKDSLLFSYHVCNSYAFEPGQYRLRCVFNNRILEKKYVYSNWAYFTVKRYIPAEKHFNEMLQKAETHSK